MNPPFLYAGAKAELAKYWSTRLPEHRTYVEPFGGSAAMLFAKQPSEREVVSDACYWVISTLRSIRDDPEGLLARLPVNGKVEKGEWYSAMRRVLNGWRSTEVDDAATFMTCCSGSFGGRVSDKTGYSKSGGLGGFHLRPSSPRPSFNKSKLTLARSRITACSDRLNRVEIVEFDALKLIESMAPFPQAFIFIDPPYLPKKYGGSRTADIYMNDCDHSELMESMRGMRAKAMLTIGSEDAWYWSDFFFEEGWAFAMQRSGTTGANRKRRTSHEVWVKS